MLILSLFLSVGFGNSFLYIRLRLRVFILHDNNRGRQGSEHVSSVCKDQRHYNFNAAPFLLPPYRVCLYIKKYTQLTIQNVYIYSIHTISYDYTSTVCLFLLH